jgi:hypothetical protein
MTYDQSRAELTVLVFEAMRVVALSPRHGAVDADSLEEGRTTA